MILTQCKDTNDIENTQIYFHEIYENTQIYIEKSFENTQIWMFESFITIITIVSAHQSGIYGLSQKSIKLLHNRRNSSKRSEFFRFYFVPLPNHFQFLDLSKDTALQIKTLI